MALTFLPILTFPDISCFSYTSIGADVIPAAFITHFDNKSLPFALFLNNTSGKTAVYMRRNKLNSQAVVKFFKSFSNRVKVELFSTLLETLL